MYRAPQHLRTYFITSTTANRRRLLQVDAHARLLIGILQQQRTKRRFELHAFVIMPDHFHAVLTPAPEVSLEKAVQYIMGNFSHQLASKLPVWTASFNEVQILTFEKFIACATYIHQNPVRAGLSLSAETYPYSSAVLRDKVDPVPKHLNLAPTRAKAQIGIELSSQG